MNTVTFYSFKGGVGRTLALANVAYELARKGSRVLVVDFDLEAPGLDSIFPSAERDHQPGLVDYVDRYLSDSEPPDVMDYTYVWSHSGNEEAEIIVMPAGAANDSYARRLSGIDWVDLYERHQGYLMFEDLKAQWEERIGADYVLIDSRTGHTDVAGICTRQLPDTLVVTFFPNEQNLRGLVKVVRDVRSEPETTGRDRIEIFFVASNVPRLDDEEGILQRRMDEFSSRLETGEIGIVHRYDSLHLLDRPLFTRHRPQSRLAKEFRAIADNLRMANVEDRRGALQWLDLFPRIPEGHSLDEVERRLRRIEASHSTDGEVLYHIGRLRLMSGEVNEASTHFAQALRIGFARPKVFLALADTLQRLSKVDEAAETVVAVFSDSSTTARILHRTVQLLRLTKPEFLPRLVNSPAVNALPHSERVQLAGILDRTRDEREIATGLLNPLLERARGSEPWLPGAHSLLGLAALALGAFAIADDAFRASLRDNPDRIDSLFNLAMARWALSRKPDEALFQRVLRLAASENSGDESANFKQCMAVAKFLTGDPEGALQSLSESRSLLRRQTGTEFSCWRYLSVSHDEFVADLTEMDAWIRGSAENPRFWAARDQIDLGIDSPQGWQRVDP